MDGSNESELHVKEEKMLTIGDALPEVNIYKPFIVRLKNSK